MWKGPWSLDAFWNMDGPHIDWYSTPQRRLISSPWLSPSQTSAAKQAGQLLCRARERWVWARPTTHRQLSQPRPQGSRQIVQGIALHVQPCLFGSIRERRAANLPTRFMWKRGTRKQKLSRCARWNEILIFRQWFIFLGAQLIVQYACRDEEVPISAFSPRL